MNPNLQVSLYAAFVFVIIGSPFVYKQTNRIVTSVFHKLPLVDAMGKPTTYGLSVHALVVFALTYGYLRAMK